MVSKPRRSSKWKSFRDRFLKGKVCAICGGTKDLQAHHIIPFCMAPEKELDEKNVIPLCEGNRYCNCHLVFGHGFSYDDYNPHIRKSARYMTWLRKCRQRIKVKKSQTL